MTVAMTEATLPRPIDPSATVTRVLRIEGLAGFAAGLAIYGALGGNWLLAVPLLLAPDLSIAGYLGGPRLGAFTYNVVHNWALGLGVLGAGLLFGIPAASLAGVILIAHTGMDRAAGYGLKFPTGFHDTHLGRIGRTRR